MEVNCKFGQYTALWRVGNGGYGEAFLVIKEGDVEKRAYILKTFINKTKSETLKNEIEMLVKLNEGEAEKIQFIPKLYWPDKAHYLKEISYYVIDYFSKGSLIDYVLNWGCFSERLAKLIFKKIVKGVEFCHNKNICHLDIKHENIIFNNEFEPLIIDLGFSK